jgi:hypothetical protein
MMSAPAQEEEEVDELLAALGYKVRSSDMADVAQKLEQLEMEDALILRAMRNCSKAQPRI